MIGALEGRIETGGEIGADGGERGGPGKKNVVDTVRGLIFFGGVPGMVGAAVDVRVGLRDKGVGGLEMVVKDGGGGGRKV